MRDKEYKNKQESMVCFLFFLLFRYAYFSVQYYAECWSGPEAGDTYAREGKATNCFNDAVGTSFTNYVYRFVN